MKINLSKFATEKNRWFALIFIGLGLAVVIIDNTILNVSIPYILRDLNASFGDIQWIIAGYALTIAALLITFGRLGDLIGRKKLFVIGITVFAVGSFLGSISQSAVELILTRSILQALGAAITLTSALALIAANFQGKERALAFGIWGAIAGASASIGPLLGGYLTTYYSWRWSLRINVIVAIIAIIGSILIRESKGESEKHFDWGGVAFSTIGLFSLIFGFIEGRRYGWFSPAPGGVFTIRNFAWPLSNISIIPFAFLGGMIFLIAFVLWERFLEKNGRSPLLRMSLFKNFTFALGIATLAILSFGQFGFFLIMPIYLENVLGFDALKTGVIFLPATLSVFIAGIASGILARKINIGIFIVIGLFLLTVGSILMIPEITISASVLTLAPALIIYGLGLGMSSAQLSNAVISAAPLKNAGEASAASATMRQVGASIGTAIIGAVLAGAVITGAGKNIQSDILVPAPLKNQVATMVESVDIESGQISSDISSIELPARVKSSIINDVDKAVIDSSKKSILVSFFFLLAGTLMSLPFILPRKKTEQDGPVTE